MTETIVLLMLLAWLASTLIMTVATGRGRAKRKVRQQQIAPAPRTAAERADPALASRP